jgi:hypothetical protein
MQPNFLDPDQTFAPLRAPDVTVRCSGESTHPDCAPMCRTETKTVQAGFCRSSGRRHRSPTKQEFTMKKLALTLGFAAATIATSIAFAGPGGGPGYGPGCADGTATTCQGGRGPGMGMGGGYGHGQGAAFNLMTPEERAAHRAHMQSLKSVDECKAYLADHQAAMAQRAKEKGITLPEPRGNACERMQARGRFG